MALLRATASISHLQYASLITEIADEFTVLCGVELELPQLELLAPRRELFSSSWEPADLNPTIAYEKACLQAVSLLQIFMVSKSKTIFLMEKSFIEKFQKILLHTNVKNNELQINSSLTFLP